MKIKHTPTPWKVGLDSPMDVLSLHSHFLFKTSRSNVPRCEDIANAAHIVKAVNMHDELVNVLEQVTDFLTVAAAESKDDKPEFYESSMMRLRNSVSVLKRAKGEA